MIFHFQLKPIEDILAKYGKINFLILSDAFFYLTLNKTEIYRYSDEIMAHWKKADPDCDQIKYANPHPDYTIQSLCNNLDENMGCYLQPVPAELHALINTQEHADHWLHELDSFDTDNDFFIYERSEWFYLYRSLGIPGIEQSPLLIWRYQDTMHIRWKCSEDKDGGIRIWQTGDGEAEIPLRIFMDACKSFYSDYYTQLRERIIYCQKNNIHIDSPINELLQHIKKQKEESINHIETAAHGVSKFSLTDWNQITKLNKPWIKTRL